MLDIIKNQSETFIHFKLENDEAYKWSVEYNDAVNMQMVLRAHGYDYDYDSAIVQIRMATKLNK